MVIPMGILSGLPSSRAGIVVLSAPICKAAQSAR